MRITFPYLLQEMDKHFIRNGQPLRRKPQAGPIPFHQALRHKLRHARPQLRAFRCSYFPRCRPNRFLQAAAAPGTALPRAPGRASRFPVARRENSPQDGVRIGGRVVRVGPALRTIEGVRARAKSEIGFAPPIFEIVSRFETRKTPIGNLIVLVSGGGQLPAAGLDNNWPSNRPTAALSRNSARRFAKLPGPGGFLRQFPSCRSKRARGAGASNCWTESSQLRSVWCGSPAIKSKLRLPNPGGAQNFRCLENIGAAMHAARGAQFAVVEGLHTHADAVESGFAPSRRFFRRDGFRIGFQRHFLELRWERRANGLDDLR